MTGLSRTLKKITPKEDYGHHKVAEVGEDTRLTSKVKAAEEEPVIPLADEEELKRARRRQRSSGGRASTVLTDDERLGG